MMEMQLILTTIVNLLRNAFVAGFSHSFEGSISLRNVASDVSRFGETVEPPKGETDQTQQTDQSSRERREERRNQRDEGQQ